MKNKYLVSAALVALMSAPVLTGCLEDDLDLGGEGLVQIGATVNSDIKVIHSRAEGQYDAQSLAENCLVWISNGKGVIRKYKGLGEVPAEGVKLNTGHYVAEAWTGDSVSASWTARYYKGLAEFDVVKGQTTNVNIVCTVANTLASVKYDASVDEVLSNYTMTIGHSRGQLTFEGRTDDKASFMMPSTDTDLSYTLRGTLYDGTEYVKQGTIPAVKSATEYALTVTHSYSEEAVGGAYLEIAIDPTEILIEDQVEISLAPLVQGMGFDINETIYSDAASVGRRAIYITSCGAMESVKVECPGLGALLGLSGDDFDLMAMSETFAQQLAAKGISYTYVYDEAQDAGACKIVFADGCFATWPEGEYPIVFSATDASGKTSKTTMTLNISSAKVIANEGVTVVPDYVNTTVTLTGAVLEDGIDEAGFNVSVNGGEEQYVPATLSGKTFTATLQNVAPNATYTYYAVAGDYKSTVKRTFRALNVVPGTQMPNSGFETWGADGKVTLLAASKATMFWDSGNWGSATMSKNVTAASTAYVHSGQYSARLNSQFVGLGALGKFAAGNAFVGEYLETAGLSAYMAWGREFDFNYKPQSLKGYFRYEPVAITHTSISEAVKGEMDKGIIYWALLDDNMQTVGKYTAPWVVYSDDTSTLFNANNEHVIAYGEHVFETATDGSGLVEINIPLEYKSDAKPKYIMCVISASRYGDYFSGGNGSVLYVDDLEIQY